ncbi:hypothetical protein, partial [Azohydromonas caseinilytica]
ASGNEAYNNIFYNSNSPDFSKFSAHNYNHFVNAGGSHGETGGSSATSGDPFVNIAALDFRLKASTAAGSNLPAPFNVDGLGRTRGADGTYDRGPFEYATGAITVSPPTNLRAQ